MSEYKKHKAVKSKAAPERTVPPKKLKFSTVDVEKTSVVTEKSFIPKCVSNAVINPCKILQKKNIKQSNVFLMTLDALGNYNIIKKE